MPDLGRELEAARVQGTLAWLDTRDGVLSCTDTTKCQEAVIPA